MKGALSLEQIEDLLAEAPARTDQERELKRRMQARVLARQSARREDLALQPKIAQARSVFETATAIAEIRLEALQDGAQALPEGSPVRQRAQALIDDWSPDRAEEEAGSSEAKIERFLAARDSALAYAERCAQMLHEVAQQLGEDDPVTAGLVAAATFPD